MKNIFVKRLFPVLLAIVLIFSVFAIGTSAVGGKTSMSFSSNSPKVGDTLTVTLRYFEFDEEATNVSGTLNFDTTIFKFVDSNAAESSSVTGGVKFVSSVTGAGEAFVRVNLEVISDGTCRIVLNNPEVASSSGTDPLTATGASITTSNGETLPNTPAGDGSNASLTSITVAAGTLEPAFSPDITEYTVVVPYTQKDGVLSCESKDPNATITVSGSRELSVGITTRTITVIATDGSRKDYKINFNRLDENGNNTQMPTENGIKFTLNDKEYIVGSVGIGTIPPVGFYLSSVTIDGKEVSAYKDSSGKAVLLYLVAADSSDEGLFLYENGQVQAFNFINVGNGIYIIKDITDDADIPEGLVKATYEINGKTVDCYKYSDAALSDFVIFSAISPKGNTGYYSYDVSENTIQRIVKFAASKTVASAEGKEVSESTKTVIMMLIIIFAVLLIMLIVALVVKMGKKSGKDFGSIFEVEEYEMSEDSNTPDDNF